MKGFIIMKKNRRYEGKKKSEYSTDIKFKKKQTKNH